MQYFRFGLKSTENSGILTSLSLLMLSLLMHPASSWLSVLQQHIVHPWELADHQDSQVSFHKNVSQMSGSHSLCSTPGLCFPRYKTLRLLNFIRFLLACTSSLPRSSCRAVLPSKVFPHSVWYYQETSGYPQSPHSDHLWRHQTVQGAILYPGGLHL